MPAVAEQYFANLLGRPIGLVPSTKEQAAFVVIPKTKRGRCAKPPHFGDANADATAADA